MKGKGIKMKRAKSERNQRITGNVKKTYPSILMDTLYVGKKTKIQNIPKTTPTTKTSQRQQSPTI